jgi:pyridinium-3,5-bisthiocarboxylic acid mononucleotide nickel chelatase
MNNETNNNLDYKDNNIMYVDCFAGCSGDMLLGAFFDMGLSLDEWKDEMSKLDISEIDFSLEQKADNSIKGTKFHIQDNSKEHPHRSLKDIKDIIKNSNLDDNIIKESMMIFTTIAKAEAKVHNTTIEKIHFHEVGAIDSILDIVGFCVAKDLMNIKEIYSSDFHLGCGTVETAHGIMPVPSPATLEIIKNKPTKSKGISSELTTPTGAAILSTLSKDFGIMPDMIIHSIGYGYGTKKLSIPNFVRIVFGIRRGL